MLKCNVYPTKNMKLLNPIFNKNPVQSGHNYLNEVPTSF